jgi:hypothetical protein
MDRFVNSLVNFLVAVGVVCAVAALIRFLLNVSRTRQLTDLAPEGWELIGHADALGKRLGQFGALPAGARKIRTRNVFGPGDTSQHLRIFDYRYSIEEDGSTTGVHNSGLLIEMQTSSLPDFVVEPQSSVLRKMKMESAIELTSKSCLRTNTSDGLPQSFMQQLASAVSNFDEPCRIESQSNSLLVTLIHRPFGKGIPSSPLAWVKRSLFVLFGPVHHFAFPDSFWQMRTFGEELHRLVAEATVVDRNQ